MLGYRITADGLPPVHVTGYGALSANGTAVFATVGGLRPSTTYTFKVAAENAHGPGPAATRTVTTAP